MMGHNLGLPEKVLKHSDAVGRVMKKISKDNQDEMYVLGLLHDIGKIYESKDHELLGAELMDKLGFKYSHEIMCHGKLQNEYSSSALDILNAADLTVDSTGQIIGYKKRIEDIGVRYGFESEEYLEAVKLSETLIHILNDIEVE